MFLKNLFFLTALLFAFSPVLAQERKLLKGRVTAGSFAIAKREVINLNSLAETRTDSLGYFSIYATLRDTILVRSSRPDMGRVIIRESDFNSLLYVDIGAFELEEVVVDKYANINSVDLGLVPKDQKQYTPAERRLKTAGDFKPVHLLGLLGGALAVDPIINAINGKTKRLKKEIEVERKELLIEKINGIYTFDEITKDFNIPAENVPGFIYYIVEDKEFAAALKSKNETLAQFLMSGLSVKYLKLLSEEESEK